MSLSMTLLRFYFASFYFFCPKQNEIELSSQKLSLIHK